MTPLNKAEPVARDQFSFVGGRHKRTMTLELV
jgi:hypothetical protein